MVRYGRKYVYGLKFGDVPLKRKIKDLLYFVSPVLVAKISNKRNKKRKMGKEN